MSKIYTLSEAIEMMKKAEKERLKEEEMIKKNTEEIQEIINNFVNNGNKVEDYSGNIKATFEPFKIDVNSKPHKEFIKEYVAKFEAGGEDNA